MAEKKEKSPQMQEEQDMREILRVRREKLRELQESGNDPYQITKYPVDNDSAAIKANFDQLEGKPVSIAGRMMSKRGMGKVSFCDLQDRSGRIQLYARKDEMDEAEYNRFKKYDIGDILGVQGVVFRTQRGEMSVRVEKVTLLSKSLLLTKSLLLDRISEDTPDCTESSLKMHISNLRKKLRKINNKDYIEAVWGIGFKMKEE